MSTGYRRPGTKLKIRLRVIETMCFELTIEDRCIVEVLAELLRVHGGT